MCKTISSIITGATRQCAPLGRGRDEPERGQRGFGREEDEPVCDESQVDVVASASVCRTGRSGRVGFEREKTKQRHLCLDHPTVWWSGTRLP